MQDWVEILQAQIRVLQRDNRMLRSELNRQHVEAVGECPMCKVRRERIRAANKLQQERRKAALASLEQRSA